MKNTIRDKISQIMNFKKKSRIGLEQLGKVPE